IKAKLRRRIAHFRDRLEGGRRGWWKRVASDDTVLMILYRATGSAPSTVADGSSVRTVDARAFLSAHDQTRPDDRAAIIEHVYAGDQLLGLFEHGAPVVTGWLTETPTADGPAGADNQKTYRVDPGALTVPGRKKGRIGAFLQGVLAVVGPGASVSISIP